MVKVVDFMTALNHSIISPLCPVWVQAPHRVHARSKVLLAGVFPVFRLILCFLLTENIYMSHQQFVFPTRSDTNWPVEAQKMARGRKFWI